MTQLERKYPRIYIQIGGSDLADETMDLLIDAIVEDDLRQPAMFTLRFDDPRLTLIDSSTFALGAEVVIGAVPQRGARKKIMTGEITALEPDLTQGRRTLVLRGYDRSHRLYRGRKTRTFLKKTDSDMASEIIREAGLSADVESTSVQHEYVMQDSQTDMDFLRARAARIGYSITVDGQKIKFRSAESSPPSAPDQEWGVTLLEFRARLTAVGQPNQVEVRGWDPKSKKAIVGTASSATQTSKLGFGKTGAAAAQQAFSSSAKVTVCDRPIGTQSEATKLAQAVLDDMAGDYLAAEGHCVGDPGVKAGTTVKVSGIGTRFSGTYFVSATRHEYTHGTGYMTTFIVNGRNPASVLAPVASERPRHVVEGVTVGIVTNVNDPDALGRVKLKFPWLDDTKESDWARLVMPGAGKTRGMFWPPEVNDEVLVAFEQGDISRPYVVGGLWNTQDKPAATAVQSGKVKLRTFKTRAGHMLEFTEDEGANKGQIQVKTADGRLITISDTDKKITVKSQNHTITMDDQGRSVTIDSAGTLKITAQQSIECSAAGSTLKMSAQGIELSNGGGKLNIMPAMTTLQSNANLEVKANALMTVQTSAIMNIQGALVKIN